MPKSVKPVKTKKLKPTESKSADKFTIRWDLRQSIDTMSVMKNSQLGIFDDKTRDEFAGTMMQIKPNDMVAVLYDTPITEISNYNDKEVMKSPLFSVPIKTFYSSYLKNEPAQMGGAVMGDLLLTLNFALDIQFNFTDMYMQTLVINRIKKFPKSEQPNLFKLFKDKKLTSRDLLGKYYVFFTGDLKRHKNTWFYPIRGIESR
ncbi:MAG: hypothetical protein Faunusvirus11_16 [Faunusvirus sp.]|jgi:hypothetical protein|uniref:Uncharacterized protein n=1 Tax=Faunusvirus sp. TaxID=2487766 RepID=A0A3G4ZWV0_9VIRU|nr:MAG: hypothetical protein Faunusvirus11_16 [Faunusvirus sp.]